MLAARQGGVVSHPQLRALGVSAAAIHRRVRAGRLHPRYRGVYAVGHAALNVTGLRWAAVLAYGPDGVISHASAGAAWAVRRSAAERIDVTVGSGGRMRRAGVRLHRTRVMPADEVTRLAGLPITTPARTVLDLAASGLRGRKLESALDRAHLRGLLDFADLVRLLERYPTRRGSPALRELLSRYMPDAFDVRSELEDLVLELCDARGLPRPQTNVVVEGKVRDFYWPRARLVVEADSYGWHRGPSALNDDRERDVTLTLSGHLFMRFTAEQVKHRRRYVVDAILTILARAGLA